MAALTEVRAARPRGPAPMPELDRELDRVSLQWMIDNYPDLVTAIEASLFQGAGPSAIRRRVMVRTGRVEFALRCEQAARALSLAHELESGIP